MYRLLSWTCYYAGDASYKILSVLDNWEAWCAFWYPVYNTFMCWSTDLQDKAGFDPTLVEDTTGWVWKKGSIENTEGDNSGEAKTNE